tara:strand:- start:357 stop:953 length:597 start_codon:yes stop_codon:yes gene_type:complete
MVTQYLKGYVGGNQQLLDALTNAFNWPFVRLNERGDGSLMMTAFVEGGSQAINSINMNLWKYYSILPKVEIINKKGYYFILSDKGPLTGGCLIIYFDGNVRDESGFAGDREGIITLCNTQSKEGVKNPLVAILSASLEDYGEGMFFNTYLAGLDFKTNPMGNPSERNVEPMEWGYTATLPKGVSDFINWQTNPFEVKS